MLKKAKTETFRSFFNIHVKTCQSKWYTKEKKFERMEKMKINVYLDDLRDCPKGFVLAKNIDELKRIFEENEVGILSLDHDLGEDENGVLLPTGYDFVKYFCENGLYCEKIYLHTDNSVGRENMESVLRASQRRGFISTHIEIFPYPLVPNKYTSK